MRVVDESGKNARWHEGRCENWREPCLRRAACAGCAAPPPAAARKATLPKRDRGRRQTPKQGACMVQALRGCPRLRARVCWRARLSPQVKVFQPARYSQLSPARTGTRRPARGDTERVTDGVSPSGYSRCPLLPPPVAPSHLCSARMCLTPQTSPQASSGRMKK